MEHYLEQLNLAEVVAQLDEFFPRTQDGLSGVWNQILAGNWRGAADGLLQTVLSGLPAQLAGMRGLFVSLLVLGIASVLISGFMTSFENHQIADIAHYIFYLLLLAVVLKIFAQGYETAQRALSGMTRFSRLVLPALCLSVGPAAGTATAAGYYELAMGLIFLVETFLLQVCLPLLSVFMLLLLMNGIWEEGRLAALMTLLEQGVRAGTRFSMTAITGLGFLQSMVAPVLDGLKRSAAQKAVSAIPALGGLAEGTAQLIVGSAVLVKNSLGLFSLLLLFVLLAPPIFALFGYGILLKLGGALMGIVADRRLTACVSRTADAVFLMLRLVWTGAACFFILAAIVTCLVGK